MSLPNRLKSTHRASSCNACGRRVALPLDDWHPKCPNCGALIRRLGAPPQAAPSSGDSGWLAAMFEIRGNLYHRCDGHLMLEITAPARLGHAGALALVERCRAIMGGLGGVKGVVVRPARAATTSFRRGYDTRPAVYRLMGATHIHHFQQVVSPYLSPSGLSQFETIWQAILNSSTEPTDAHQDSTTDAA